MIKWEQRLKNKVWWVSTTSALILLVQQLGLNVNFIPKNYVDIINTIFVITALFGITVDTSTEGTWDKDDTNITVE